MNLFSQAVDAARAVDPLYALLAASGCLLLLLAAFIAYRVRYWVLQGRKLQEPGYLTPRVTWFARVARFFLCRFVVWYKVGPFYIINPQNIRHNRRKIILPNHQIEHDAVVIAAALRFVYFRALMAINQIYGWRKAVAAWAGIVAVHHDKNPMAAVRTQVKALKAEPDSSNVTFAQGMLVRDNVLREGDFYAGAVAIARLAGPKEGPNPFVFVPTGIHYDRDMRHQSWFQRLVRGLGLKGFRSWFGETTCGVTVAFGEPIELESLPADNKEAMRILFGKIKEMSDLARTETLKRHGQLPG